MQMNVMLGPHKFSLQATIHHYGLSTYSTYRDDSRFAPSQWETASLCNDVSRWLGASLDSTLQLLYYLCHRLRQNILLQRPQNYPLWNYTYLVFWVAPKSMKGDLSNGWMYMYIRSWYCHKNVSTAIWCICMCFIFCIVLQYSHFI